MGRSPGDVVAVELPHGRIEDLRVLAVVGDEAGGMSVLVWTMVGLAMWHFAVLVPDRFYGGIMGAFIAALAGALLAGYMLPSPGLPDANPPGVQEAIWPDTRRRRRARHGVPVRNPPRTRRRGRA